MSRRKYKIAQSRESQVAMGFAFDLGMAEAQRAEDFARVRLDSWLEKGAHLAEVSDEALVAELRKRPALFRWRQEYLGEFTYAGDHPPPPCQHQRVGARHTARGDGLFATQLICSDCGEPRSATLNLREGETGRFPSPWPSEVLAAQSQGHPFMAQHSEDTCALCGNMLNTNPGEHDTFTEPEPPGADEARANADLSRCASIVYVGNQWVQCRLPPNHHRQLRSHDYGDECQERLEPSGVACRETVLPGSALCPIHALAQAQERDLTR